MPLLHLRFRKLLRHLLFFTVLCFGALQARAQTNPLDIPITGDYSNTTLIEILRDIEQRHQLTFYYDPTLLPYYAVSYHFEAKSLLDVLREMLELRGFVCFKYRDNSVVICRSFENNREYVKKLVDRWEKGEVKLPEFLLPLEQPVQLGATPTDNISNKTVRVTGRITDEQTREAMSGVTVRGIGNEAITTDAQGRFSFNLPAGKHVLTCSFIGYRESRVLLSAYEVGEFEVRMQSRPLALQEVVVEGNVAANKVQNTNAGVEVLSARAVKELPALLGEADVVKSLSILAGVSSVGEGATGFNVRGGNADQNLVLQDGMVFFNTSHVLGFFSVFNPDLVRSTTLYKGHIPAEYGGRLSSVLDVGLRDGNYRQWLGSAGLGLTSAKVTAEGPLLRGRVAVLGGYRTSYSDWMLRRAKVAEVKTSSARFDDLTVRLSARTGESGTFSTSFHRSNDFFRYAKDFGFEWNTTAGSVGWKQVWREKYLTNAQVSVGQYGSNYFIPSGTQAFDLKTGLQYANVKLHWAHLTLPKHQPTAGITWNLTSALNENLTPKGSESAVRSLSIPKDRGMEWGAYVGDTWKITPRLSAYVGVRYSFFQALGEKTLYEYASDGPRTDETIVDSTLYGPGDVVGTYGGLEPRVSLNFKVNDANSLKVSYNRLRQYIHQISNTTSATPADIWQVSNPYIPPQIGDNFSLGWFSNRDDQAWEYSVEGFYKTTQNMPAYKDFAQLLINPHLETEILTGQARSYGAEASLRKNKGWFTGLLSYTWSRAWQQASSPTTGESVNFGDWFPANFDQPHQLNISTKMTANPVNFFSFNFVYRTGRPVSAPTAGYSSSGVVVPYFPLRNNLRLRDYHRLDVAYTWDMSKAKISGLKYTLTLSVYNVYARNNPFSIYFKRDKFSVVRAYELSVLGSAIPAATLTFSL